MKKVIVEIDTKTCQVSFHIEGISGTSCTDISQLLAQGYETKSSEYTQEFYAPVEEEIKVGG